MTDKLLCRIWGHKLHPESARYYAWYNCERCHMDITDVDFGGWLRLRLIYIRNDIRDAWWRFQGWIGPCPDCGLHFGKHDETQDHILF